MIFSCKWVSFTTTITLDLSWNTTAHILTAWNMLHGHLSVTPYTLFRKCLINLRDSSQSWALTTKSVHVCCLLESDPLLATSDFDSFWLALLAKLSRPLMKSTCRKNCLRVFWCYAKWFPRLIAKLVNVFNWGPFWIGKPLCCFRPWRESSSKKLFPATAPSTGRVGKSETQ